MARHSMRLVAVILLRFVVTSWSILTIPESPLPTYDVVIVGGGPAGLSAASALGRVRRTALLIDSGDYRNAATAQMHDVIGDDGTVPSVFRALAREQISAYPSITMMNGTVAIVIPESNGTYFTTIDTEGYQYLSKKVILATGMKDLLPDIPGLAAAWGHGIYWCPWCDGWEHKDAPFANMGPFSAKLVQDTITATTLNANPIMLTNGTYNDAAIATANATLPQWSAQLELYDIGIENRPIASFGRVKGNESDYNDDLVVTFGDKGTLVRNAIHANFPAQLASGLPSRLRLKLTDEAEPKIQVDTHMESNVPGIFVVGDANSDESSNVPHAMWSAKRAVVYMHGNLAQEYTDAAMGTSQHAKSHIKSQESFEAMKRQLKKPLAEHNSAEDLLEYMMK